MEAARQAIELGDTRRLIEATLANQRGFSTLFFVDEERVQILETAIASVADDHPAKVLLLATLLTELSFDGWAERRVGLVDSAISLAQQTGDDATAARALTSLLSSMNVPSLSERATVVSDEAISRAEATGDPILRYWAHSGRLHVAARTGRVDEHHVSLSAIESLVRTINQPTVLWDYHFIRVVQHLLLGETDQAEREATEAVEIGMASGQPDAALLFGTQVMTAHWQRGTSANLIPLLEEAIVDNPGVPVFSACLALTLAEGGRTEEARALLQRFADDDFQLPMNAAWITGMCCYAEASVIVEDKRLAGQLFELLAPWRGLVLYEYATVGNHVSHYLGCLVGLFGRFDEADEYFAQSARFNERVGAKFLRARTNLERARALIGRGLGSDAILARSLLDAARDDATAYGYARVAQRAETVLEGLNRVT